MFLGAGSEATSFGSKIYSSKIESVKFLFTIGVLTSMRPELFDTQ